MSETDRFLQKHLIQTKPSIGADLVTVCTDEQSSISFYLLQFLEDSHLVGPGLDIFKLAVLNKRMLAFV